jgi:glycosyltransferase involved in cell wall biosynthesis
MNTPLVMFGEDWHGLPSSTRHLAREFCRSREIVWVNSIGLRRPRLAFGDVARASGKLARMIGRRTERKAIVDASARPTIVDPRAIAWPGSRLAGRFNRTVLGNQLRAHLERQGLRRPVLWTSLPSAVDLVGALGEQAVVYYCCDDFTDLAGVDHKPVSAMEQRLAEAADLVVTVNAQLAAKFDPARTVIVPHGVDLDLFGAPAARADDLPTGQVAGFYGSLSPWIDLDLIACAARRRPDWTFFLIGPVRTDLATLAGLANVVLAGSRPHHELPRYARHWTASLLPFRDTPQIRNCNPLKLREYLAAGRPVIGTPCPAIEAYGEDVRIVRDADQLCAALDAARDDHGSEKRWQRVAEESWEARAVEILNHIDRL